MNGVRSPNQFYRTYHIPGQSHHPIKRNAIFFGVNETIRHALAKSLGGIMLKKFGDVKFNDKIINCLRLIEDEVNNMDFIKDTTDFISEAVPNKNKNRRVDLVKLKDNTRYEFETQKSEKKKDDDALVITIYIGGRNEIEKHYADKADKGILLSDVTCIKVHFCPSM